MEARYFHDSQQKQYRSLFGAAPTGARVTLRLAVYSAQVQTVTLRLWEERENTGKEILVPMTKEEDGCFYSVTITLPDQGCLLWYYFLIQGEGKEYYGNNAAQVGGAGQVYDHEPPSFQITVYAKDSVTPDWFKHGVVYQIFPDRFYHSEESAALTTGKPNAVMHQDWSQRPAYIKDDRGCVLKYDFFGGNINGIREKLPYLQELGITVIYLNPIFSSSSNHRYDTGDYKQVDDYLGTEEEFTLLCQEAAEMGMRVVLDGVFSHTGDDSIYFNKYGRYPNLGAYQSKDSPYYSWYKFIEYPDKYDSWWGVGTLPEVKETTPSYMDYVFKAQDSVLKHWMAAGISGWRLDVADELPPLFLKSFWQELKQVNKDAVLIGEVWEDASNKISYGEQRAYLGGGQLDSVMNYVMRSLMLEFVLGHVDAVGTRQKLMQQLENYPMENFYAMLNLIGSHDVERVLTVLSAEGGEIARERLHMLWAWQMTMPGTPCVYYGDEAGVEGGKDPDNRSTYPWGQENTQLLDWCKELIHLRRENTVLRTGRFIPLWADEKVLAYGRAIEGGRDVFGKEAPDGLFIVLLNPTAETKKVTVHTDGLAYGTLVPVATGGQRDDNKQVNDGATAGANRVDNQQGVETLGGSFSVVLPPRGFMVLAPKAEKQTPKRAGVLLHPTSLPRKSGESITAGAHAFIDWLAQAGQKVWQVLPLNPTGVSKSPYLSFGTFAGNPEFFPQGAGAKEKAASQEFLEFAQQQKYWLEDFALYAALKKHFDQKPWWQWPQNLQDRDEAALAYYRKMLESSVEEYKHEQYRFFRQWGDIRGYANKKGIKILGDMPIFVAQDSADCWAHQEFFQLDDSHQPLAVAGVPPDYFSASGQVWGNPIYDWQALKKDNYQWWIQRFTTLSQLVDEVRIDHFRGFAACWAVPAGAEDAREGEWVPGPGEALFKAIKEKLPHLKLVAEDLGVITEDIHALKDRFQMPGMRIMEFMTKDRQCGGMEFDTCPNVLAYTGTHDNNTLWGWYGTELNHWEKQAFNQRLGLKDEITPQQLRDSVLAYLYSRRAATVIVPMQDILALPEECRMNIPGTAKGNWGWQMTEKQLEQAPTEMLQSLCRKFQR